VTPLELATVFGTSRKRIEILRGFFRYREDLRNCGTMRGVQWLDGSFSQKLVGREPNDVDIVTIFFELPTPTKTALAANPKLFKSALSKTEYLCDAYMTEYAEPTRKAFMYWLSFFSHTRQQEWKGMLEMDIAASNETNALDLLQQRFPLVP
jgi:hypothetical protein